MKLKISTYNKEVTSSNNYIDPSTKMMFCKNYNWDTHGDNGKGDSIGRTFEAYYTYKDPGLVDAIMNCWVLKKDKRGKSYLQGYRSPDHSDTDMSRDHLFNTVLTLIASGESKADIRQFVELTRWKISDKYNYTLDLWLWTRMVSGVWWAKILSPMVDILLMSFNVIWNKLIYKLAPFNEEPTQAEYDKFYIESKGQMSVVQTKRLKMFGKVLFPSYTMLQYAWRLHYSDDTFSNRLLKRMLLKIANKNNYLVRMLLDDKDFPTREEVSSYRSMKGGRWDGILNPQINDRDLHIITPERYPDTYKDLLAFNVLDEDLVRAVYNEKRGL